MSRQNHGRQLKLPKELLDKVGGNLGHTNGGARRKGGPQTRKEQRRNDRVQKRTQQRQPRRNGSAAFNDGRTPIERARLRKAGLAQRRDEEDDDGESDGANDDEDPFDVSDDEDAIKFVSLKDSGAKLAKDARTEKVVKNDEPAQNGSLKRKLKPEREDSPPPHVSRKAQAALDEDDAEIAALEKKLGMKGAKKLGKAFDEDGLTDLLDDLSDVEDGTGQKRKRAEYDDYLQSKRSKSSRNDIHAESDSAADSEDDEDLGSIGFDSEYEDEDEDDGSDEEDPFDVSDDEDAIRFVSLKEDGDQADRQSMEERGDFDGFSDDEPNTVFTKPKENPYLPAVSTKTASTGKYVPPSMRGPPTSDAEVIQRLKRQLQGLLNRLSEANLLTILKDIEQIFASNARQYVTETLIDLLIGLIADRTALNDTFIILHAGFIAAVYKVIGAHFGAQLLERLVSTFSRYYEQQQRSPDGSKEATNLIALMAELYTFQVIGSQLLFDYLRLLLAQLSDLNTELLLKVIKNCGPQLRHDDPSALKDIVVILQKAVAGVGEASLSVRTKFMIETINNLKNNRQKTGVAASQIASEHTTRMKKTLGTLNTRSLQTSEPLGIGLEDIRNTEKQGKWWLVGASWKNEQNGLAKAQLNLNEAKLTDEKRPRSKKSAEETALDSEPDLATLARALRINTDIRRAIFTTLMSSTDYKDCAMKLTKLRLKKTQESEIARVIILCAGGEKQYNPYYTVVAKRLCIEKRGMRMGLQFGLWELFKRMGESASGDDVRDDDGEDGEGLDLRKLVNLAKMFGDIIADSGLSISVLKVLTFTYLQPKTQTFLEVLLVTILQSCIKKGKSKGTAKGEIDRSRVDRAVTDVFSKVEEAPQMAKGLQYFMEKFVRKSDLDQTKEFKKAYQGAVVRIQIASSTPANDDMESDE